MSESWSRTRARHRAVADAFAPIACDAGAAEVWLVRTIPDFEVAVVWGGEPNLEREVDLRGLFIDLVCDRLNYPAGKLSTYYSDSEAIPDRVRQGRRLYPPVPAPRYMPAKKGWIGMPNALERLISRARSVLRWLGRWEVEIRWNGWGRE